MLKRLVADRINQAGQQVKASTRVLRGALDGPRKRRVIRLTPTEDEILERAALKHGSTVQGYVIAIARAHAGDARVGDVEREQLGMINYQLLAMGRNVNQIAHRANAFDGVTQQQLSDLQAMDESLKTLAREIHAYLILGRVRWRIIDD